MGTPVTIHDFVPVFMDRAVVSAIFNDVAAEVGPKQLKNYAAAIVARDGKKLTAQERQELKRYPASMAQQFFIMVAQDIPRSIGAIIGPHDSGVVRKTLTDMRDKHVAHYQSQLRTQAQTADDRLWNAHVDLHIAVHRSCLDRLIARLP